MVTKGEMFGGGEELEGWDYHIHNTIYKIGK